MSIEQVDSPKGLILIIDDIPDNLQLLARVLSKQDYQVRLAANGEEALLDVQLTPPDLILLDIQMPGMDGYQVCEKLKSNEQTRHIPVIFLSVAQETDDKVKAFAIGAADFVTKPFATQELLARIEHQFHLIRLQQELRQQREQLIQQNQQLQQEIQERQRAEETLCASESQLRGLFAAMTDVVLVLNAEGRYVEIAPTNPNNLYLPPAELIGKTLHDVFSNEQANLFLEQIHYTLQTRQTQDCEYCLVIDRREVWFSAKVSPISQDTVIWVARDITDRKIGEIQLLAQSQALAAFSNSLKQLHRLSITQFSSVEDLFVEYIQAGRDVLNFSAGAVGRIHDSCYTFLAVQSDIASLVPNLTVSLSDAYCGKVAEERKTVTFEHVGAMVDMRCHPLYQSLQIESYIGTPIFVDEALYGTLCFFSQQPRPQGFENHEKEIIELMAQSIGKFIATRQTEKELSSLFAAMTDAVIVRDSAGRCLKISPSPTLYKPAAEMLGKTLHETLPLEVADLLFEGIQTTLKTGETVDVEYSLPIQQETKWFSARISPLTDDSVIIVARDISARKQLEIALQHSEAKLSSVLNSANAAIASVRVFADRTWEVEYRSVGYERLFGFPMETFISDPGFWFSKVVPEDLEHYLSTLEADVMAGRSGSVEYRFQHGDGTIHWISEVYVPQRDEAANCWVLTTVDIDISDRKCVEEALKQAKEAAELSNRAKSEFLANMSHELRTPLNAILGFTQVVMRECASNQVIYEYLEIINRSGEHLLNLINDVLEMSRIEAGKVALNISDFDLHYLLKNLEDMLRLKADSKDLDLICEIDPDVPQYVQGDEGKLRQVLINILGNAIKFTTEGGVALRVRSQVSQNDNGQEEDKGTVEETTLFFEVEDTGPGIAPDEVETIFEPFVQARREGVLHEGTGLGLSISRTFVQLMGGDIRIHSIPNQGTLVQFEVQINTTRFRHLSTYPTKPRVIALAHGQPTYRILVVEDHWANRQLLCKLLRSLNFDVQSAVNGQQALYLWQSWHPHLIWMDIRMPVMDGYEATQKIRAMEADRGETGSEPKTVIIALTASAFEEDRARALEVGCTDFVGKPFREGVILEKIATHLGVQYVYEPIEVRGYIANESNSRYVNSSPYLYPSLLQVMPMEWITELEKAAVRGSDQRILQLIQQIPPTHAAIANVLTEWVKNFQFHQIMNFIQNREKAPQ